MMLVLLASVRLWTGRAGLAVPAAQEAHELFRSLGDVEREVQAASVLGRALLAVGLVGEGFRTLDLAIDTSRTASGQPITLGATAVAAASVSIGDPERALRAAALVGIEDLDPSVIGESDRLVALGLALLQMDQVAEAVEHLETSVRVEDDEAPSGYALSALACARAVQGRLDDTLTLVDEVMAVGRATYLDRVTALCASGALLRGLGRDDDAKAAFERARDQADRSDDRIAQVLVRLADCESSASVGILVPELDAELRRRLGDLGIDATGWRHLFRSATQAGVEGSVPSSPR